MFWCIFQYYFVLKMFIAYLWNNDSAARWFIARGLGGIYISSGKFWINGTRYTRVWEYILIWNVYFLHMINVVSQPAFAMGLGGICIMEKTLGKWRNMVGWDVYSDIIMPLKFLTSYINTLIL